MSNKKAIIIYSIISLVVIIVISWCLYTTYEKNIASKSENHYYTYAIIFYPDHKTTIEGYVDKFFWCDKFVDVTIDGEKYTVSPENVVIVKRKDLVVNKEDTNEVNNN